MKISVLQVVTLNKNSGVASLVMNLYRHIDRERFDFKFLTWHTEDSGITYQEEIIALGGTVYGVPYYKKHPKQFLEQARKIVSSEKFSVIHCHEFLAGLPMLYFARQAGIPVRIAHSHNPAIESRMKQMMVYMCRGMFKKYGTVFMACSEPAGEFLFGKGVPVVVLKNGIEVQKYTYSEENRKELRRELSLENRFVVGTIGRLVPQKNHAFLLDVFAHVVKEFPGAALLIVGDGKLKKVLTEKVTKLSIQDNVIFLGLRSDVHKLLSVMDVFVLPSIYEGLGIVLVEAQANGLPCIVSDAVLQEVNLTENFSFLSLNDSVHKWYQSIVNAKRKDKDTDDIQKINSAGYNIKDSTQKLQKIYLSAR